MHLLTGPPSLQGRVAVCILLVYSSVNVNLLTVEVLLHLSTVNNATRNGGGFKTLLLILWMHLPQEECLEKPPLGVSHMVSFLLRMYLCLFYEYEYFVCTHVCVPHACLVLAQVRSVRYFGTGVTNSC